MCSLLLDVVDCSVSLSMLCVACIFMGIKVGSLKVQ